MSCDLHTHTNHSDGSYTPAQLVAEAKRLNLTIALTDHNTVTGLPDFLAEAEREGVRAIGGTEISTDMRHALTARSLGPLMSRWKRTSGRMTAHGFALSQFRQECRRISSTLQMPRQKEMHCSKSLSEAGHTQLLN